MDETSGADNVGAETSGTAVTVLLVEDNEDLSFLLNLSLNYLAGFTMLSANNGIDGLMLAVEHQPDCMVIDVIMPGLDGFKLVRALRGDPATAAIPLILLTALAQPDNRLIGVLSGADRYLVKPVTPQALIAAIREVVAMPETARFKRMHTLAEDGEILS